MIKRQLAKVFIIYGIVVLTLSGCANSNSEYINHRELAIQQSEIIIQGIMNEDAKAIEGLFCSYLLETHLDLEGEIIALFDFIEGDIISYDSPEGSKDGGKMTERDGVIEQSISARIENIRTTTGKTYRIIHGAYSVYDEYPEYVGITNLSVRDEDLYNKETGEGEYKISSPEMWE